MKRKLTSGTTALRRTAAEIKRYRHLKRIIPVFVGMLSMILVVTYIVSIFYDRYGSFTVSVSKFDSVKYALTLSETRDFSSSISRLNSKASQDITNIDGEKDLPQDLDMIDGEHNGKNYIAYTFYCKNAGTVAVDYEYLVNIMNMSLDIEKAVRVRLYVNGEATTYARTKTDGSGPEEGTVEFYDNTTVVRGEVKAFAPDAVTKFTIVVWLEGWDPDCVDDIIGGEFKIDMEMNVLNVEGEETSEK